MLKKAFLLSLCSPVLSMEMDEAAEKRKTGEVYHQVKQPNEQLLGKKRKRDTDQMDEEVSQSSSAQKMKLNNLNTLLPIVWTGKGVY